jgi:alpha-amylase
LPAEAGQELASVRDRLSELPDGQALGGWLRGGFWRNFLVKYAEVGDAYWKMLRLSHAIEKARRARPDDPELARARVELWRGQANDAYWHGVFGGLYLPHLRRAVKGGLINADRLLGAAEGERTPRFCQADINGDGRVEVAVRTSTLSIVLNPEAGGSLTELSYLPGGVDLADVLTRRREAYHARVKAADPGGAPEHVRTIHDTPGA